MSATETSIAQEIARIRNVSDLLCTGHARLRDRYKRRALAIDLSVLGISTWLVALAFVDDKLNLALTPAGIHPRIWAGSLAVAVFSLSIIQLRTDWKARADAHQRTLDVYAEVKREAGYVLASGTVEQAESRRVLARYDMASAVGIAIPESEFLKQKKHHRIKVAMSRHLDSHPAASLLLTRLRFWFRDNIAPRRDE